MDAKDYLKQAVDMLIKGDQAAARDAYKQHVQLKAKDMLKEDHDYLLTEKGLETFLKTLHKRAKKAKKEDAFFTSLAKHTGKEKCDESHFNECAKHFSKNKKKADRFIHDVENKLKLTKDDPAKDIRDTEAGDK